MEQDKDLDKELEENSEIPPEETIQQQESEAQQEEAISDQSEQTSDDIQVNDVIIQEQDEATVESLEQNDIQVSVENVESQDDSDEMITVRPVKFQEFELTEPNRAIKKNLDIMQDISMHVSVELGRTKATIKDVMDFKEGSIVELDKIAGEQVEVYVNNKLVAKGEVIVIEDKFGVRVTSTNLPKTIQ